MSHKHQMFDEMMKVATERLKDRDPQVIAKNANVAYEAAHFVF